VLETGLPMQLYDLRGISFLIVDDNRFMRRIIVGLLQGMDVTEIIEARSGKQALEKLRQNQFDVIITDLEMEDGNGFGVIDAIRGDDESPDPMLPIIVLSANTMKHTILQARDAGMTEFLAKPVTADTLYRRIVTIIEGARSFVRTGNYFGPDRRRKSDTVYMGPKRRRDD
jgi:two-component system, chemotaxis family, chemotaxis protein CheY